MLQSESTFVEYMRRRLDDHGLTCDELMLRCRGGAIGSVRCMCVVSMFAEGYHTCEFMSRCESASLFLFLTFSIVETVGGTGKKFARGTMSLAV